MTHTHNLMHIATHKFNLIRQMGSGTKQTFNLNLSVTCYRGSLVSSILEPLQIVLENPC